MREKLVVCTLVHTEVLLRMKTERGKIGCSRRTEEREEQRIREKHFIWGV